MFLKQSPYKIMFGLLLISAFSSAQANFTYNDFWQVPAAQQCDNWNYVSYTDQAVGVLSLGKSRKVTIPVPEGAIDVLFSMKSHASHPSVEFTKSNYTAICHAEDISLCIGDVIPVVNNGLADSLEPTKGANIQIKYEIEAEDKNIFLYHLNKRDPQTGVTANEGSSSMFGLVIQFQLTPEACAKRAGVTLEDDEPAAEPVEEGDVVNLASYKQAFTPVILTPELKLHINRIAYDGKTWASDLSILTAEEFREMAEMAETAEGEEEGIFKYKGKVFFSMDLSEDVTYEVLDGINEDNDGDGSSIIDGDCNDNDPSVHPKAEEAGKKCSLVEEVVE